ncbi:flavodoxin-dependent (E)-4-hydroxy-3-methylbut-2-enyl-diphosphate synthase, partial [Klebsiella pneumoniae]|uniref:flavodoxin-dependent (E)-4-hydroxy-3-methylbut-2-enyl-diphosphate synthase n=1 Tax=Klebsiella pneumoniae TaxID=573 RepID=UPI003EE01888
ASRPQVQSYTGSVSLPNTLFCFNLLNVNPTGFIEHRGFGADPVEEIKVGFDILKSLRIRSRGINFIACPTCSRQEFDVIGT